MKPQLFSPFIFFTIIACMAYSSCNKYAVGLHEQNLTDSTIYKKVSGWLDVQIQVAAGDVAKNKIAILAANTIANEITVEKLNDGERLIIVPLRNNFTSLNNTARASLKKLVLIESESGEYRRGDIIEIIPANQLMTTSPKELIANIYNNRNNELNGIFSISSITNQFVYELEYNKGKITTSRYIAGNNSTTQTTTIGSRVEACTDTYMVTTTFYSDGSQDQDWKYLYTICTGNCEQTRMIDSPELFKVNCDGGDNSGGSSGPPSLVEVNAVIKALQDACLLGVVNKVSNAEFKNQIVKLFNETYVGVGQQANIKFQENSNMFNADGTRRAAMSSVEPGTWVISLNPTYGDAVSNEYWASAVIHELVHSFIRIYQKGRQLDMTEQHQQMFRKWINQMSDFLVNSYNMPAADAKALAVGGLDEVLKDEATGYTTFKKEFDEMAQAKYGISLAQAENTRFAYKTGSKGTKCSTTQTPEHENN